MSGTQWLAVAAIAAATVLAALLMIWTWRDMRERKRPIWLRVVVLATGFVTGIGVAVWIVDLKRHPHRPGLTRSDWLLQRFGQAA